MASNLNYQASKKVDTGIKFQLLFLQKILLGGIIAAVLFFASALYIFNPWTSAELSFMKQQAKPAVVGCLMTKIPFVKKKLKDEQVADIYKAREMVKKDITIPLYSALLGLILGMSGVIIFYKKVGEALAKDDDDIAFEEYQKKSKKHDGLQVGGMRTNSILIDQDKDKYSKELKAQEKIMRKRVATLHQEDDLSHFLIVGQSGTGKTTLLYDIMNQLGDKRKIIHDNKMAILEKFFEPEKDYIFNPMDTRSIKWTIFNDIQTHADAESVAQSLLPDNPRSADPMWDRNARGVLIEALKYCKRKGKTTNKELVELLTAEPSKIAKLINSARINEIFSTAEKTNAGIKASMAASFNCLQYLEDGDFSIKEWVKNDNAVGDIYVTNRDDVADIIAPLLTLFLDLTSKFFLSLPDSRERRLYFMLDELAVLKRMSSIVKLITNSRSKGGSVMVGFQTVSQPEEIYGNDSHTIFACGTKFIFRAGDGRTADYIGGFFGSKDTTKVDESYSIAGDRTDDLNVREHTMREDVVDSSLLINLPDRVCLLKPKDFDKFFLIKSYVQDLPSKNIGYIEREDLLLKEDPVLEEEIIEEDQPKEEEVKKDEPVF